MIPTPALDRIAANGLRYTNFHSTALCSPTRAALITGRNHHSVGLRRRRGTGDRLPRLRQLHHQGQGDDRQDPQGQRLPHVVVRQEPQHPGLSGECDRAVRSVAGRHGLRVLLRLHGRRHQPVAARQPVRNTTYIYPFQGNPSYNLTTAMADEAIAYMNQVNTLMPEQPFFVYYVPGGTHAPHHATPEWIKKSVRPAPVRQGLEHAARADLREPEEARRDSAEREDDALAG